MRRMEGELKGISIDWEDAATSPTLAEASFDKETHSPDVFHDGHGAEVDIWAIGYLIRATTAAWLPVEMIRLGARICKESRELTARGVLSCAAHQVTLDS
jgi:hypothetical protein